jgi:hypothetical protein
VESELDSYTVGVIEWDALLRPAVDGPPAHAHELGEQLVGRQLFNRPARAHMDDDRVVEPRSVEEWFERQPPLHGRHDFGRIRCFEIRPPATIARFPQCPHLIRA